MSVNIFKNGILSKIAGAVGDAVPLINNFLTNQEGKGAADANTVYVLNNKIEELNSSLENLKPIYSTEEKIVGIWVDGKPIYQVTIIGTTAKGESIIYTPDGGIDTVISIKGQYTNGRYKNLINSNYQGNECSIYATNTDFYAQTTGAYDFKAIIEYVKS